MGSLIRDNEENIILSFSGLAGYCYVNKKEMEALLTGLQEVHRAEFSAYFWWKEIQFELLDGLQVVKCSLEAWTLADTVEEVSNRFIQGYLDFLCSCQEKCELGSRSFGQ